MCVQPVQAAEDSLGNEVQGLMSGPHQPVETGMALLRALVLGSRTYIRLV